jgi:hypothetical protein
MQLVLINPESAMQIGNNFLQESSLEMFMPNGQAN